MLGLTQTCGLPFVCFLYKMYLFMLKTFNFRCLHKTRSAAVPSTTDFKGFSNLGFIGSNGHIISASSTVDLDKVPGPLDATAIKQPLKKANTFPYQVWPLLTQFFTVSFLYKLICLEGKPMTPHGGEWCHLLFLPATPLEGFLIWHDAFQGPSTFLVSYFWNYKDTRTPSGVLQ